ncbi:hypothetical protein HTZ97_13675 [Desulfuromonas acetoxidans]|uniref:hypothetical protein n=1 Tax=Desulfuromonas acetoxidans TaxID=891 RepID=UPI0015946F99|nr:hypothetical protein [Desulfuromonas acetoxidans]MBF0644880.1 hypothetical protein [Desulfuromonas acetoxidans]NVD25397.1 hypothetical protein [Desulfuromonas acetoxidans]NVE17502.1 hypothetical protein [Desulfuromonas acetoxidans]
MKEMMKKKKVSIYTTFMSLFLVLLATSAFATGTSTIIDYSSIASQLITIVTVAIGAGVGVGVLVLGAKFGWRFFKSFTK